MSNKSKKTVTASLSAENTFTDNTEMVGYFNLSLSGTWVGSITIQRSFDKGINWFDIGDWTQNTEEYGLEIEEGIYYKAGFKTGNYTSGTCNVRLSQ